ncbi:hypothetical protein Mgra_00007154 [Meloidogyne graminicola]|uniref:Uncharacterized protein n=1 Tax=Meloidogyne graminicola TaxID=189291 RepID=A0A8S9ZJD1_9BILA|nr:hypothetical protein Mgra_00007154 [Meloidogyne graminicola]
MVQLILLIVIINTYLTFILGILFNFLLYYLAKKYSTNDLKEFYCITIYHISWHLLQTIFQTLGEPFFFVASDNNAYIFLYGPARWIPSIIIQNFILVIYLCILGCSTTSMALQFIDRYLVICKNHTNHFRRYLIMGLIVLINALLIIIVNISSLPAMNFQLTLSPFVKICGLLFDIQDPNFLQNLKIIWSSDYDNFMQKVITFNITTIFCYKRIKYFLLKNLNGNWSTLSNEAMQQVLRNMLLQAILALLASVSILLLIILTISGVFSLNLLPFELLIFLPSQWVPVLNPLVTIITVHKYRTGFYKIIKLKSVQENSNNKQIVTPIVVQNNNLNENNILVQERCITPIGRNNINLNDFTYN